MRQEFVAGGFGGQGIILMGVITCIAAGLYDDKWVTQRQSYGPASRGGACRTDVILSDEKIDYAGALSPDTMVFMSPQAVEKYLPEAKKEKTVVIIDSSLVAVEKVSLEIDNLYFVPATDMAEKEIKNRMVANMLMLGAASALTGFVSKEALLNALADQVKEKFLEINKTAIQTGYEFGERLLKE